MYLPTVERTCEIEATDYLCQVYVMPLLVCLLAKKRGLIEIIIEYV